MNYRILLQPSGSVFTAPDQLSLLESGLQSGMNLPYGCETGSCGRCLAQLLEGQTQPLGYQDYVLTELERAQGYILLCRHAPQSDLTLAVILADQQALPLQTLKAKVEKLERLSEDILVLQLRTPRAQTLHFFAGQEINLEFTPDLARRKSVASCPCNGMQLQFHFRRIPDDRVSDYVFNHLARGDAVLLKGPLGEFLLDEHSQRSRIFIAYETGFAPIKSLIEHTLALELAEPIYLYRVGRTEQAHYLANYCRSLGDAFEHLHCVTIDQRDTAPEIAALLTRIEQDTPLAAADVYAAVPLRWELPLRTGLAAAGVPTAQIHLKILERY